MGRRIRRKKKREQLERDLALSVRRFSDTDLSISDSEEQPQGVLSTVTRASFP